MDNPQKNIKKLYYSIGEVSKITELKQYVLRYWETEFKQLKPTKNKAGNRTYKQKDIDLIVQIKDLLYNQKFIIFYPVFEAETFNRFGMSSIDLALLFSHRDLD